MEEIAQRIEAALDAQDEKEPQEVIENNQEPIEEPQEEVKESDGDEEAKAKTELDDTEDDSADDEPVDEEQGPQFETVEELAEAVGKENIEEFLKSIKHTFKIDGEEQEISLYELQRGHQRDADYTRKSMELADQRKAFEAQREEEAKLYRERVDQLDSNLQIASQFLINEYQAIDWEALRLENPGEYAARMQDLNGRKAQIDQAYQAYATQRQQYEEGLQSEQNAQRQRELLQEKEFLVSKVPELADNEVFSQRQGEMVSFLVDNYGFTQDEINTIGSHKALMVIMDAMKAKQQATSQEIAQKKVKNLPKLQKPGVKEEKTVKVRKRNQSLKQKARKSQKLDDWSSVIETML